MTFQRLLVLPIATVVVAALLALAAAAPAHAVSAPCDLAEAPSGATLFRWSGAAGDGNWVTPGNWSVDGPDAGGGPDLPARAPNFDPAASSTTDDSLTGFVCVQSATPVAIQMGFARVHVQVLQVGPGVTLNTSNARIMVYGAAPSHVSTIEMGARLNLHGSYLGGPGQIDVAGHLEWGLAGGTTASLTNDVCGEALNAVDACVLLPTAATGRLRVAADGQVVVNGRGVNLFDGYTVQVRSGGALDIVGKGYIAADRDSAMLVDGSGTITFAGDGNVFEGRPNSVATLANFVNEGTVRKSGGNGVSSINATYAGSGQVLVDSGRLNIANGDAARVMVNSGAALGTGTCPEDKVGGLCVTSTTTADLQNATVTLLGGSAGITIEEQELIAQNGDVQPQVAIEADAPPGDSELLLDYDAAVLNQIGNKKVEIFNGPSPVPDCGAGGVFPAEVSACVSGRTAVGRSVRARIRARANGLEGLWRAQARPHFYRATTPVVGATSCAVASSDFPNVDVKVWRRNAGVLLLRRTATASAAEVPKTVRTVTLPAGVSTVSVPLHANGYLHVRDRNSGLRSVYYRAIATGAVKFKKHTRTVARGKVVTIRGVVDSGTTRRYRLYYKAPGMSRLRAVGLERPTGSDGSFSVSFKVPRSSATGKWRFAVRLTSKGTTLGAAMSHKAVTVNVVRPRPVVPQLVTTLSTDLAPIRNNQPAPIAEGGWTRASALTCTYNVR